MTDGTALFSIIVAMYKVEPYLPAFLASLDAQGDDLADAEIVFVDDGSPDDSRRIVEEWAATRDANTVVVAQENQGVAAARESGTLHAGGTWITYADPDDVLEPGYLQSVRDALESAKETDVVPTIVSTRLIYTDDTLLTRRDAHPLKKQFSAGRRIVSLRDDPQLIKLSAATSFLRREDVLTADIHWDHRIRPNFEDAAFIARYLLTFDDPTVLVVPEARYLYRRRTATTSLTTTVGSASRSTSTCPSSGGWRRWRTRSGCGAACPSGCRTRSSTTSTGTSTTTRRSTARPGGSPRT